MEVYNTVKDLKAAIALRNTKSIGFVPTMGALHNGHLSLVKKALEENELVICSVFINPKQFNNEDDLKVYPRTLALDTNLLKDAGCDILFAPSVDEIYTNNSTQEVLNTDFGNITKVMEAKHRPGHFDGVIMVVKRLFEIVAPQNAYFGEKDFQQLIIIKHLVETFKFDINIIGCPIVREQDGLAMSSRNVNLSNDERKAASLIPKILFEAKEKFISLGISRTIDWVAQQFQNSIILKLDYFEIANDNNLSIANYKPDSNARAFIAVYVGKTRLIDNIKL